MDEKRLLDINEAALFLNKSEKEIKALVESGDLPAYQIGGMYLRFKLEQLQEFKEECQATPVHQKKKRLIIGNVRDFFYFNDFYILAVVILIFLIYIIAKNIS